MFRCLVILEDPRIVQKNPKSITFSYHLYCNEHVSSINPLGHIVDHGSNSIRSFCRRVYVLSHVVSRKGPAEVAREIHGGAVRAHFFNGCSWESLR